MADRSAVERSRAHFARWTELLAAATPPDDELQDRAIEITVDLLASCGFDPFGPEFDRPIWDDLRSTIQALVDLLEHVPAGERRVRNDVGVRHPGGRIEGPMRHPLGRIEGPMREETEQHAQTCAQVLRGHVVRRQVITVTTPWKAEGGDSFAARLAVRHAAERAALEARHRAELEQTCPGGC